MKFLFVIMQPLVQRDFERFGIKFFLDKGHDITVLDLSEFIHPNNPNDQSTAVRDSRLTIREIRNRKELQAETETFAKSDLVFNRTYSLRISQSTYPILRILAKTGTPYVIMASSFYPGVTFQKTPMSMWSAIKDIFIRLKKMNLQNSVIGRLPRQLLGIPEAKFIVYNGQDSLRKLSLDGKKTIPIHAHTADYDLYLDRAKTKVEPENQAVFLDQNVPYHPALNDAKAMGTIDPDAYFGRLRVLFDRIEHELNMKVVIACHPRSDYRSFNDIFGDRKILYGDTINQIVKSRLVLAHISTAIGLAVLFRKPVMLLTTKDIYEQTPVHKHAYEGFSDDLGVPLRYFDNPDEVDLSGVLTVNDELYDRYIHKYIKTPDTPSKPLWDIVHDAIVAEQSGRTN